ncbi:DNA polymerase alpha catalytic subunit [Cavenderia fasciculata]|uniref:DNA polymerase n=1 Tax=Cavenderia fasciculata TaxID=261658 RepID=F4QBE7_CACFS|nr:DNA polymerase alpha catalytic subunit [Cavenderia fasciculata]EGG14919.1 DNA polymerase alpha catalytic subunit [Cavenderia fasciculata]|eukprot:XP_004351435.1 DNA polymerase alpha catalytic subunit [Cavenderia fasciculata]
MLIPLTKQLTNLAGNLWNKSLTGNRAERIEYLLLHNFYQKKYILPDKQSRRDSLAASNKRAKAAFSGGLVLEPKRAYYDKYVVLLDFNSLYPSIIQEYNVCFTTIPRIKKDLGDQSKFAGVDEVDKPATSTRSLGSKGWELAVPPSNTVAKGILPQVLNYLVNRRKDVRKKMEVEKDATIKQQLDIKQQAIKLVANSMYGCLGFTSSRFYALPLAELVTRKGRENLEKSADITERMNHSVIYGDTDSIMVYTGVSTYNEAQDIGRQIKTKINNQFKNSVMEIGLDGVFKRLLLLKKKKYAALIETKLSDNTFKTVIQNKGLDIVRRDWCDLTKTIGNKILEMLLSGEEKESSKLLEEIKSFLEQIRKDINEGLVSIDQFIITKTLSANPEAYNDGEHPPHVNVALEMKRKGLIAQQGDAIPYVITLGNGNNNSNLESWSKRALHPSDITSFEQIDLDWYLAQQILPPTYRITELLGIEEQKLASWLGMSNIKYKSKSNQQNQGGFDNRLQQQQVEDTRFKDCEKPEFNCPSCRKMTVFSGIKRITLGPEDDREVIESGTTCQHCQKQFGLAVLLNQLTMQTRSFIKQHQDWNLKCVECSHVSKHYSDKSFKCTRSCNGKLIQIMNCQKLLRQLYFMKKVFVLEHSNKKSDEELENRRLVKCCEMLIGSVSWSVISDRYRSQAISFKSLQESFYSLSLCFSSFKTLKEAILGGVYHCVAHIHNQISIPYALEDYTYTDQATLLKYISYTYITVWNAKVETEQTS